ncbi:TolC family protein [Bremerella sp. JC817]|uniref:TolC family protein n=1 Tax=Bremerella sp. JC817 TaxID=3231756 RepID=UPI003459DE0D
MKYSQETFRSLVWCAVGLAAVSGCRSTAPKPEVFHDDQAIATDIAKATELPPVASEIEQVSFDQPESLQQVQLTSASEIPAVPSVPQEGLTLQAIQDLALANNPAIMALSATANAEQEYQFQVGRSANPEVGYAANQLADQGTDQHLVYVQREFVTGGKLQMNQDVLGHSVEAQRWEVETQRYRVMTDVRLKFVQALVAQRQMEMIDDFHGVVTKGVTLAERRFDAQEASQAEVLQAEIQMNEVEVMRQQAEYRWKAAWKEMAAAAGVPNLEVTPLSGSLEGGSAELDWDTVYLALSDKSPELQAAFSRVRMARSNLSRQEVQAIPNVTGNLQAGVDNATGSGMLQLQLGAPIPVFNDNSGNVSAAYHEYSRATHDVKRIEMSLQTRLAQVSQEFDSARFAVDRYEHQILPKAKQTLSLAEKAYEAGEFSFVQTLIARRTYFDTNLNYLDSLGNLSQAQAKVDGLLLTGALDMAGSGSLGDALRGQTFSQQ